MPKIKSICGRYLAIIPDGEHEASLKYVVIDLEKKVTYERDCTFIGKNRFLKARFMIGYSAYGDTGMNHEKVFTLRFGDFVEGVKCNGLIPDKYVIKIYSAVFKRPKVKIWISMN